MLGGAAAIRSGQAKPAQRQPLLRQPLFVAAAVYVVVTGLITVAWRWPEIHDALMPASISDLIYPISKTDLSPVRLLHFLALAYVTAKLLPTAGWTQHPVAAQVCRMGRFSLEIFCLGVLLAPLADMLNAMAGDALLIQLLTALFGVVLMAALGAWLELNKRLSQRTT